MTPELTYAVTNLSRSITIRRKHKYKKINRFDNPVIHMTVEGINLTIRKENVHHNLSMNKFVQHIKI